MSKRHIWKQVRWKASDSRTVESYACNMAMKVIGVSYLLVPCTFGWCLGIVEERACYSYPHNNVQYIFL